MMDRLTDYQPKSRKYRPSPGYSMTDARERFWRAIASGDEIAAAKAVADGIDADIVERIRQDEGPVLKAGKTVES